VLGERPPTVVGIDEAGRGAWLGPLVVGAVAVPRSSVAAVAATGARDSKTLSPLRREEILARLEGCTAVRSVEARPREIDRHVVDGRLNELEARLFGELARPFAPAEARVDACDANARRFAGSVARHAGPGVRVIARHHLDALDPLVGAASVVAKVRRDRAIRALAEELGEDVGSGYPSDPVTVRFVRRTVAPGGPIPEWLRGSWSTTPRVIGVAGPETRRSRPR
jgi:ribonuclease HII